MKPVKISFERAAFIGAAAALLAACGDTTGGSSSTRGGGDGGAGGTAAGSGGAGGAMTTSSSSSSSSSGAGGGSSSSSSGAGGAGGTSGAGGAGGAGNPAPCSPVERVDILMAVDNSRSMADKQAMLSLVLGDLVHSLVNPTCVDANGAPAAQQPASGADACPGGTSRVFPPMNDIHVGVISSSIGGHGADSCPNVDVNACPAGTNTSNNDHGHLLSRQDPCSAGAVPTYQSKGFLAWDPAGQAAPPGEASEAALTQHFKDLVSGVGQIGCGYESQLEGFYRFLIDPTPYESISVVNNKATPSGIDSVLLAQRADFLRPDSLLSVFVLTDENDCSTKEYGQFFYVNQLKNANASAFHLPAPRAECAVNPNDPCCKSCGQAPGNCPADPTCVDANGNLKALTALEDAINLRCFDQKRRFGIDFMYPVDRYTAGLTSQFVPDVSGNLVPNPIFSDLNPNDALTALRCPEHVLFTGIVGVPWQDLARNPADLTKGFKDATELSTPNGNGITPWDIALGDPSLYVAPKDPHMIESIAPRSGTNPITGTAIAPPGSPDGTNPINGHERTISQNDDLQYACIMPLPTPRDCNIGGVVGCECMSPVNDNPVCAFDAATGGDTLQVSAKAYPGVRELSLIKSLGSQGVAGSICAAQIVSPNNADYAYRPSVRAFIERATPLLKP